MATKEELIAFVEAKLPDLGPVELDPKHIRDCFVEIIHGLEADNGSSNPDPDPGTGDFVGSDIRLFRYKVGTVEDAGDPAFNKEFPNGISSLQDNGIIGWDVAFVVVSNASGANVIKREPSGFQTNKATGNVYFGNVLSNSAIEVLARKSFAAGDPGNALPIGGTTGQVIGKLSDADGDVGWIDQAGGSVAEPTTPLVGTDWNLAQDGYHKSITISGNVEIDVTIEDGEEGNLLVTGAGTVTIADTDIQTIANGKTIIVVKRMGAFIGAKGIDFPAGNVTPPPPTGGIVDDANNAFGFTLASGYTLADHERRINGGSWSSATNPISVGNINVAIGSLEVRVKAAAGRDAGPTLTNTTAFTATGGVQDTVFTGLTGITNAGGGSWPRSGTGVNLTDQNAVDAATAFASGVDFRMTAEYADETSACFVGAHTSSTQSPAKDTSGTALWVIYVVSYMGTLSVGGLGVVNETTPVSSFSPGAGKRFGYQRVAGVFSLVYSTDNGTTYSTATTPAIANPSANVYQQGAISLPTTGQRIYKPKFELL